MKVTFVGDIFPANMGYHEGYGVASQFLEHKGEIWKGRLHSIFNEADMVFGNLESPLIDDSEKSHKTSFAGYKSFVGFLKEHRIGIVSIANNHILEQGKEGFYSTCKILEDNKVQYVGKQVDSKSNIRIVEKDGIRIGFCAFNEIDNIKNPSLYANLVEENICRTIDEMSLIGVDYKVVSLHWGNEFINYPSTQQQKLAHLIIDKGVDIVVGHHPHVIQPVEEYNNGVIFYSLGNFLFDMMWSKKVRKGMVVKINFSKERFTYKVKGIFLMSDYGPELSLKVDKSILKINNRFSNSNMSDIEYIRSAAYHRLWQRILMKKDVILNWRRMSRSSRKVFISKFKEGVLWAKYYL